LIEQIIEARKEGRSIIRVSDHPKRRALAVKPKVDDIKELLMYLIEKRLAGLATKVLLYTIGKLSLDEIHAYIDNLVANRLSEKAVKRIMEVPHETKKYVSKRRRT
jgi:hypothetical protein